MQRAQRKTYKLSVYNSAASKRFYLEIQIVGMYQREEATPSEEKAS